MNLTETKKLGFGCMRFPLLDQDDPASIDQEQLNQMVDLFMANGFTYFDTAYPYHKGQSEVALGKALMQRYPREAYTVTDKCPCWAIKSEEDFEPIFAEQLQRTGLDYFDYYWLHNLGKDNYPAMEKFGGFEFLKRIKADGRAKHIGFSYHDGPELLDKILTAHPETEYVQLQINYIDWENPVIQARANYEVCVRHGKPVIVMEPVKGGGLASLPEEAEKMMKELRPNSSSASWAVRFAASLPNVVVVLSGMSTYAQVADNVAYMKDFQPLTEEERAVIDKVTDLYNASVAIPCTGCRYCVDDCPKKLDIPTYFSMYNFQRHLPGLYSRATHGHGKASECIGCRSCERHCPQHLPITDYLKQIADHFGY